MGHWVRTSIFLYTQLLICPPIHGVCVVFTGSSSLSGAPATRSPSCAQPQPQQGPATQQDQPVYLQTAAAQALLRGCCTWQDPMGCRLSCKLLLVLLQGQVLWGTQQATHSRLLLVPPQAVLVYCPQVYCQVHQQAAPQETCWLSPPQVLAALGGPCGTCWVAAGCQGPRPAQWHPAAA